MMSSVEIRQEFLDFFQSKGHTIVPSAPIVIKNDPTLLFTNAGMNQFKDYFLGNRLPPFTRVVDTQKCLRVSGKHNDLEEVGVDTYHHTMFEMLGNWSFGDYFKKEAIAWSWELLTEKLKMDKGRLYVTVFEGDTAEKLPRDDEAFEEWKKIMPEARILLGNKKDNFWEMGDTGPCGPCTEIHVDCRTDQERALVDGSTLVNNDHPQVIEIWNNVFIQFNRKKDGSLEPLPSNHVDTGMGFERLTRVLQQKQSNYDTDIFTGTIAATEKICRKKYSGKDDKESIAFRVIADHIRAISFTIADGQLPSNTGAGYVIRRILRRAVRYYYSYLDYKQPLLYQLLPVIAGQFDTVFPELNAQLSFVSKVVQEEEEAFLRTVDKGLSMLNEANQDISGEVAFKLYDTFGFPLDLTKLVAAEKGLAVDEQGFDREMKKQKERSRTAGVTETQDWVQVSNIPSSVFVGYDTLESKTKMVKYRKVSGKGKELYQLVLEKTPFYAESGGQVGDTGKLIVGNEQWAIVDTKKENDLIIHFMETLPPQVSGAIAAVVDAERRKNITIHHSVTHLMHAALRKVLGKHVAQKGSLVNEEHLRFDFSHFAKMNEKEIAAVEKLVNEKIRENIPVAIKTMQKDEAIAMGAMALFGEKYGDVVRVVIMDPEFSVELCGGTHVGHTGELGSFKIKSESAVAAGVRRIEALCGKAAEEYINSTFSELVNLRALLNNPADLNKALENLLADNSAMNKKIDSLETRQLDILLQDLLSRELLVGGVSFIGAIVELNNADALKKLCFAIKLQKPDHLAVLCANIGGKAQVAISISDTLVMAKNLDAAKIIKEQVSPLIKGGGGGQKNLATAGGQDASQLDEVIKKVRLYI